MRKMTMLGLCAIALSITSAAFAQDGPPQGGPPPGGQFGGPGGMRRGPGGRQGDIGLLFRKDVQDDLQLSADQKSKVADLQKKFGGRGPGGRGGPGGPGGPGQGGQGGPPPNGGGQGGPPGGGGDFDPDQMRAQMEKRQAEEKSAIAGILSETQVTRLAEIKVQIQGNMAVMDPEVAKKIGFTDDQNDQLRAKMDDLRDNMRPQGGQDGERPSREQMQSQMKKMQDQMNAAVTSVLTDDQKAKLKSLGGRTFKRIDQPGQDGFGPGGPGGGRGPGGGGLF